MHFSGPSAVDELCACLLDLRRSAEAQGRLDFTAEVESAGSERAAGSDRAHLGGFRLCGRADQLHRPLAINDSTLRRAMTIYERDRSTSDSCGAAWRESTTSAFRALTLADIRVARRDDGVTADLRFHCVTEAAVVVGPGPIFPGIGTLQASVSSRFHHGTRFLKRRRIRLAQRGRIREAVPGASAARDSRTGAVSGFAVSPALSPRAMLMHYGRRTSRTALAPCSMASGSIRWR